MEKGIGVSKGIELGRALVYQTKPIKPEERIITTNDVKKEKKRVDEAITAAVAELEQMLDKIDRAVNPTSADLLEIHIELSRDPLFLEKIYHYIEFSLNSAPDAVLRASGEMAASFEALEDKYYAARSGDIRDIGNRIAGILLGVRRVNLSSLPGDVIIFANDLTPSETIAMDRKHVLGFLTRIGSPTSHTAILAKSMEIPAIVGAVCGSVSDGDFVIIDGSSGEYFVNPDEELIQKYTRKRLAFRENLARLKKLRNLPAVTPDGRKVEIVINIAQPLEANKIEPAGAQGVGLFRTEFLYMNSTSAPDEESQFEAYREAAMRANGKPVIIRTLDIGGDKRLSYLAMPKEENPFLGYRAIRFCLDNPEIFKTQLRAILRASAYGDLRIMFPMICAMSELRRAKQLLQECKTELTTEGQDYNNHIKTGMMVEIPSAAAAADVFAGEADFFSIGTNDLCQYTLAVDRMNQKIANLYTPFNPGVLRLLRNIVTEGHRAGIPVGMCGEMASDPMAAVLLLGMGLDEFSVSASNVPYVKDVIRKTAFSRAKELYEHVMTLSSSIEIKKYLEENINAN
ncbi:phosphoenolpyruvate--protein phosphotransferase [Caproiciproducens sp. CPB-2]|uniref:phosphoenolpyruvate--protein phosphotransferase n=1 Tax=Caproiciproducens sp. CPB-2 TaxID=3030017 RepID=UPI0023DA9184|nr:phosphoenolpyruvate--protein phosphotransferase [Caproiciproducens sp. CPB-2]MDF1494812.1 phosphoenolpyruvate--protein phosphotransferase [Caproiciproducens sp. CPB-2]